MLLSVILVLLFAQCLLLIVQVALKKNTLIEKDPLPLPELRPFGALGPGTNSAAAVGHEAICNINTSCEVCTDVVHRVGHQPGLYKS